jgi:transcription initiation factor IIE alpha subunit
MSESDIYGWFQAHDDYIKVVKSIETTPKKSSEIAEHTGISIRRVASVLESLQRSKAVMYQDDRWRSTDLAITVLKKYYG